MHWQGNVGSSSSKSEVKSQCCNTYNDRPSTNTMVQSDFLAMPNFCVTKCSQHRGNRTETKAMICGSPQSVQTFADDAGVQPLRACVQHPKAKTATCHIRALRNLSDKMRAPRLAFSLLRRGMRPRSKLSGAAWGRLEKMGTDHAGNACLRWAWESAGQSRTRCSRETYPPTANAWPDSQAQL